MKYGQGGGYTDAERQRREKLRLKVAGRFERGDKTADVARDERVSVRTVEQWRRTWREGGTEALRSVGSPGHPKLTEEQFARLETELARGPLAHGWDDQRWTLARIAEMIDRLFGISYTLRGVGFVLERHGWTWQVPARRAVERDEQAVQTWQREVWPQVKRRGRPQTRG